MIIAFSKNLSINLSKSLNNIVRLPLVIAACFALFSAGTIAQIKASDKTSKVSFSGQHAGMDFKGQFERWNAVLVLPPASNPSITATFYMKSAKTGDSIYDSTLPEFDWFDVDNHSLGKFASTKIEKNIDGYEVWGDLTLKNITKPLRFMLTEKGKKLNASFDIDRLAYHIGLESDPEAEWVSKTISMSILIAK